jgi:hypothetical protein
LGTGHSSYCFEHRKKKHRKIIDADKKIEQKIQDVQNDPNQIIKHSFHDTIEAEMPCQLKGCNNSFKIKIIPRVFVFPKYCPRHRNEYQRELFTKRLMQIE